jgi:hypothetical protein
MLGRRLELSVEQVGGNRLIVPGIGGADAKAAAGFGTQTSLAHELLDGLAVAAVTCGEQLAMNAGRTITVVMRPAMDLTDSFGQLGGWRWSWAVASARRSKRCG